MMYIIANTTWGKALLGKIFSKMLKKKGFNAKVKILDFKTEIENEDVVLKLDLEVKMAKNDVDKLIDNIV